MQKRQLIIIGSTILILAAGYGGCSALSGLKKAPERKTPSKSYRLINTLTVHNDTLVQKTPIQGKLMAQEKVEIYPEATGRLLKSSTPFKVGQHFRKGEVLLAMDGSESMLSLKAQRSSFISLITQILADIKIDYPEAYEAWKNYLGRIDADKALEDLPSVEDPQLKSFLSGRGVVQQFYAIKSLENRQSKFTITAPFDGSITMGNVNQGTLLRAGQKVGEFMRDGAFELEAAIPVEDARGIKVNDKVRLRTADGSTEATGKIIRIANNVDPNNQRITLFASVSDPKLKEGMYLEGVVEVAKVMNAFSINRNLILPDGNVYVVEDTVLAKKQVEVIDRFEEEALVKGLREGDVILNQVIEGAYEGMLVKTENR